MSNRLTLLWRCIVGPALHTRYNAEPTGESVQLHQQLQHRPRHFQYEPNRLESATTTAITGTMFVVRLLYALWPILLPIMYRRNYFSREGGLYLGKSAVALLLFLLPAFFLRGLSRYFNDDYVDFIKVLVRVEQQRSAAGNYSISALSEDMEKLRQYDFEFYAWPVDFAIQKEHAEKHPLFRSPETHKVSPVQYWLNSLLANIIGVRMIYPGCTGLINAMVGPQLNIERTKWLTERKGNRYKIRTHVGDEIDTLFLDRRNNKDSEAGKTLVICCEGNAGFWEVGACSTPNHLGYSLLGWNHPGFAGSSGWPFPENDRAAVAAVYHFATTELGFSSQEIVLFAWSIGGYTSSWLASVADPPVKALVLDATFDNIHAMAKRQMPPLLHPLVESTIKTHFDLDVARNVRSYSGPIMFVRRTRDEIISLVPGRLETNCINHLIVGTLQHRYPALAPKLDSDNPAEADVETIDQMYQWLAEPLEVQAMLNFKDRSDCRDYIKSFEEKMDKSSSGDSCRRLGADTPLEFRRKLLAYVLLNCVRDFNETHCAPLPHEFFRIPSPLVG